MSADYQNWLGRTQIIEDLAVAAPLQRLAALLDHETPPWLPGEVPPLGHWLSFLPSARQSEIGEDGHPQRGSFLPPVPLPRRMWAGSRIRFHAPVAIGAAITRKSTISSITPKTSSVGDMIFVTVLHEVHADSVLAVTEEQDIVYRGHAPTPEQVLGVPDPLGPLDRIVVPDPVMLFRFSALTFNSHRIHYDTDYARQVEGYPGLVVHGPLTAMLLADLWLRAHPGRRMTALSFRAQRPLFVDQPLTLRIGDASLSAHTPQGHQAMVMDITAA